MDVQGELSNFHGHNRPGSDKSQLCGSRPHEVFDTGLGVNPTACRVFVWDLDETLIIFRTLSNGRYAECFKGLKDSRHSITLGRRWENLIIQVCDEHFFYEQVEDYNAPTLDSWRKYDNGEDLSSYDFQSDGLGEIQDELNNQRLAYRHRQIAHLYKQGLETLLKEEQLQEWRELYELTDIYTDGWLTAGRTVLQCCLDSHQSVGQQNTEKDGENAVTGSRSSNCVNVLVTSGSLVPSLVKCLLFKLDKFISDENVYSSSEVGKLQCFDWIRQRFSNPDVKFCVIGDDLDECEAAQALRWPFLKVDIKPDGIHRLTELSVPIIKSYMRVIYGDDVDEPDKEDV